MKSLPPASLRTLTGIYTDTDTVAVKPLSKTFGHSFIAEAPYFDHVSTSGLANGCFGLPQWSEFLKYTLESLQENIRRLPVKFFNTGPAYFTACLVSYVYV